ncbi:MAG TPA: NAD(+)/NADH kinase [Gammaproteobacteria bacterium]|nr:NAD(+)/NADH kinase [Gammaproteobacteria bacterium]
MYKFKHVGFWGRLSDRNVSPTALRAIEHVTSKRVRVFVPPSADSIVAGIDGVEIVGEQELAARIDVLVAVGGDGTMLHAARSVAGRGVPLVGINLGRLGFLTDVLPEHMLDALDAILSGDHLSEDRRMLEAQVVGSAERHAPMQALNDVALQKRETGRILDFVTSVDGSYVNTHGGDGLIVATATGSTAYALSCGGPIIQPDVDAFVMVPICPHTLSDRPLVLKASCTIEVRLEPDEESPAQIACDGEFYADLRAGETLRIRAARERLTLLHPKDYNYYELLRSKLNWGGTKRFGRPVHPR